MGRLFDFEGSINKDLRIILLFLRSMIVREMGKGKYKTWDAKKDQWRTHYFTEVECKEVDVNQKFGALRLYREVENDVFIIEGKELRYQFPSNMLLYVIKFLSKAIK